MLTNEHNNAHNKNTQPHAHTVATRKPDNTDSTATMVICLQPNGDNTGVNSVEEKKNKREREKG